MNGKIYAEGAADVKFLRDFIRIHFGVSFTKVEVKNNIVETGGYTKLKSYREEFKENSDKSISNVIIFDADYLKNDGGFIDRLEYLKELENNLKVAFDIFLFPNNTDNGDLELLLENVINEENQVIFDCWLGYEECLTVANNTFTIPAKKSKIYSYMECLLPDTAKGKDLAKDRNRDFTNTDHWKINDLNNPYVLTLKNFLEKYFD